MATTMRSWWLDTQGATPRLDLREIPVPQPGPGQLLLRVRAAGLNRGEFIIGGLVKAGSAKALGIEAAGEVVQGSTRFPVGSRVMAKAAGGLAEYVVVNEAEAMPVPACYSWEEAGAAPVGYATAHDMVMMQGGLRPGGWLLVLGISSGVGVASLQLAKALGAKVIGTSGSADKLKQMEALGLDVALNTRRPDFLQPVLEATGGHGVELAINLVGGSVFAEGVRCLAYQGRLATVGYVDGQLQAQIDLQALHAKRLVLFGVSQKQVPPAQKAEATAQFTREVLPWLEQGRIRPLVDRVYSFDQLPAARERMEANAHAGKLVVTI